MEHVERNVPSVRTVAQVACSAAGTGGCDGTISWQLMLQRVVVFRLVRTADPTLMGSLAGRPTLLPHQPTGGDFLRRRVQVERYPQLAAFALNAVNPHCRNSFVDVTQVN